MSRLQMVLRLAPVAALAVLWGRHGAATGWVWLLSCAIGWLLRRGEFGFSGPLRRALSRGDGTALWPIAALLALLIVGSGLLFSLATPLGLSPRPLRAPLSLSLVGGAFLFGIGMVMAGRCASGTLAAARWSDGRAPSTLAGLVAGVFVASLQRPAIEAWLPVSLPPVVLLDGLTVGLAMGAQLVLLAGVMALLAVVLRALPRPCPREQPATPAASGDWLTGALTVVGLALLLLLLFAISGEPWKVLWGLAITGAHLAQALGWEPHSSAFWSAPSRLALLTHPSQWWTHAAVVMDLGVLWGAVLAGAGDRPPPAHGPSPLAPSLPFQASGGFLMGWGGFFAYGCNISGFLGGVMSFSLHGWLWLFAALAGASCWLHLERAASWLRSDSPNDPA